ncbi:type I-F CRISPR-associated protein Csy1 [Moraxella pluranimalium]|uniref:Type I-F CRISPR-associated protein Csy1 n=1 Tax=Moraxella pluranimalium TaxID=470453 RepID=A0A1T0CR70_9GAMM|nr:type I-F CRISPR-associated protein Csy1 [Moraxella pluranimalium]OOS24842.1 type I-F CRISPR-associated protein Csy1 [Moraxella pluranimalium]
MITNDLAQTAVSRFLEQQIDVKSEKLQKQLLKAQEDGNHALITECQAEIDEIKQKFERTHWLDLAVNSMAKQLKFGTHISKGIHPDAKGDNVNFIPKQQRPNTLVGTHSLANPALDANGNAAALPLASFFDFDVAEGVKVRDLILADNEQFIASLSDDKETASDYHARFKQVLQSTMENPTTHERNKQMLWVTNDDTANHLDELQYINIIPLYPSALSYEVYLKINQLRYSDENKKALENRFKPNAKHTPYVSMKDLATVQLGGSKPQNISQLMSRQGGRNYLLPSLPPKIAQSREFALSKFAENFFHSKTLKYHIRDDFEYVIQVVKDARNNVDVRDKRKDAIDRMLHTIFAIAHTLQDKPAGWSKDYALSLSQKVWLDPYRADLDGEEEFAQYKSQNEWQKDILDDFASWFNNELREQFKNLKYDIADAEFTQWKRVIEEMQGFYQRMGKGVFL